jgi:hypothetical protein
MSEPNILAGTRTVDDSRLWRSTVWVVLGVLTVVVGRTLATLLAGAGASSAFSSSPSSRWSRYSSASSSS